MTQRIRIGLIVPSSDATYEPDFYMAVPPNVTLHSHRMWLPENGLGKDDMDRMNSEVLNAVRYLTTARMDAIAYGGTTSSFYRGPGWDQELIRMIEEESGVPAAVTTHSVAMALRSLGIRKLSIATPYPKWNNERLWEYMEKSGFEVLNLEADDWAREAAGRMIDDREPDDILDFSLQALHPEADGIFCSCTAWRALEMVDRFEQKTAKPAVTSNQANIWAILGKLRLTAPIEGLGRLLAGTVALPREASQLLQDAK